MHWPRLSWNIAVKIKQMKHWSFANGDILTNLANILTHRAANLASIEPCPASSIDLSPAMDGMDVNASIEKNMTSSKSSPGQNVRKAFVILLPFSQVLICNFAVSLSHHPIQVVPSVPRYPFISSGGHTPNPSSKKPTDSKTVDSKSECPFWCLS